MILTIITGASKGIGKAIAADISEKKLSDASIFIQGRDPIDFMHFTDVYDAMVNDLKYYPGIDHLNLILCAGSLGKPNQFDLVEFSDLFRINVLGNLAVIKAAMNFDFEKVRIVWFAGGGAAFPFPQFPAYSASKVAVVRTVENFSIILKDRYNDVSIIALAPGAVETDMLKQVEAAKCEIRTRTDISEPVNFVRNFITDEFDSKALNGKFLHVRDIIPPSNYLINEDLFTLRRKE